MLAFLLCFSIPFLNRLTQRPRVQESTKSRLQREYKAHKVKSYDSARVDMYNTVDCSNNELFLVYGGNTFDWKCGGTKKPSSTYVNAEHVVPQSFFKSKTPMVSDLNHLFSAPAKLNNVRSNYKFAEFDYSECAQHCKDFECQSGAPSSNPDAYSCLSHSRTWMPRKEDRGRIARAVLYFFTMYDEYDISLVGSAETFKKWNRQYAPDSIEKARNELVNKTQGNRNPYIDDPSLADEVF